MEYKSNSAETTNSVIESEIDKFNNYFKDVKSRKLESFGLYRMNEVRVPFITESVVGKKKMNEPDCLKGYNILEVGCGAGFLTIALSKLHAKLTSLDPGVKIVDLAKSVLCRDDDPKVEKRVTLLPTTIEEYAEQSEEMFDVVILSEVLEHVTEKASLIESSLKRLKPGGSIIITTYEKNFLTWLTAIILMENIFGYIPQGTHDWNLFVPISDLVDIFNKNNCSIVRKQGYWRNLLTGNFEFNFSPKICFYALHVVKQS